MHISMYTYTYGVYIFIHTHTPPSSSDVVSHQKHTPFFPLTPLTIPNTES